MPSQHTFGGPSRAKKPKRPKQVKAVKQSDKGGKGPAGKRGVLRTPKPKKVHVVTHHARARGRR